MIRRIYADNYKCLVNFECKFDNINLILGANGSGKSAVFDALRDVRDFTDGKSPISLFRESTLTRWQKNELQTFEIEIEGNGGVYVYRLEVEHEIGQDRQRVRLERVTFDGKPLYEAKLENIRLNVHLFRDDHSPGPEFGGDWSKSGLPFLGELAENTQVTWLKRWMGQKLICLQIDPIHVRAMADVTELNLDAYAQNYVGWYRHRVAADMNATISLYNSLNDMYEDFRGLTLEQEGGNVQHLYASLGVREEQGGKPVFVKYSFAELSEGERTLIILYTLLQLMNDQDTTLCIDEPDSFLALAEIQPWLLSLKEAVESSNSQSLLISHHPELINNLAPGRGLVFERQNNGPARVRRFDVETGDECLTPSEVVARGME